MSESGGNERNDLELFARVLFPELDRFGRPMFDEMRPPVLAHLAPGHRDETLGMLRRLRADYERMTADDRASLLADARAMLSLARDSHDLAIRLLARRDLARRLSCCAYEDCAEVSAEGSMTGGRAR